MVFASEGINPTPKQITMRTYSCNPPVFKTKKEPKFAPSADYIAHRELFFAIRNLTDGLTSEQRAILFSDPIATAHFENAWDKSEPMFYGK
jgi:hypothetical protein